MYFLGLMVFFVMFLHFLLVQNHSNILKSRLKSHAFYGSLIIYVTRSFVNNMYYYECNKVFKVFKSVYVNTCNGTMKLGMHVCKVIIYNAMCLHVHFSHHFLASACGGLKMRVLFTLR